MSVLDGVTDLFVAKGKKVMHFDLAAEPLDDEALLGLLLGRSGKLRAPSIRTGTRLLVGYSRDLFESNLL